MASVDRPKWLIFSRGVGRIAHRGRKTWAVLRALLLTFAVTTAAVASDSDPRLDYATFSPDERLTASGKLVRPEAEARFEEATQRERIRVSASQKYKPRPALSEWPEAWAAGQAVRRKSKGERTKMLMQRMGWVSAAALAIGLAAGPFAWAETPADTLVIGLPIYNFSLPSEAFTVPVPVVVAYGSDLHQVERVALEVAGTIQRETESADSGFTPTLVFTAFTDTGISFNVTLRSSAFSQRLDLVHLFIMALHDRFASEGIEIPLPQRVVRLQREAREV